MSKPVPVPEPEFVTRTRASYDVIADEFADWIDNELAVKPLNRAVLHGFAELVGGASPRLVADIGCGAGRTTRLLHQYGLEVVGMDISSAMLDQARARNPELSFRQGSMLSLDDLPSESHGGILAWYSIIHIPPEQLPVVFAEFARVLAPGGYVQLAFQAGTTIRHLDEAAGHAISLDFQRLPPADVEGLLAAAGLQTYASMTRQPDREGDFSEQTPQAFVLARKPTRA